MIARALSPYVLGVLVLGWQASPPFANPTTKTEAQPAGEPSAQKSADERFEALLAATRKEPEEVDWAALRHAFAQTRHYHPYNDEWKDELTKVRKDLANGNLKAAETALDKLLERERFMRLDALALAAELYEKTGDKDKAQEHQQFAEGIAGTLFVPEQGMSFEKPIVVLFINEEYLVLRTLRLTHRTRSLREKDGHHFNVFTIPALEDQPGREVYFNIDMPFNARGKSPQRAFDQAKKPEAKKQVPTGLESFVSSLVKADRGVLAPCARSP